MILLYQKRLHAGKEKMESRLNEISFDCHKQQVKIESKREIGWKSVHKVEKFKIKWIQS